MMFKSKRVLTIGLVASAILLSGCSDPMSKMTHAVANDKLQQQKQESQIGSLVQYEQKQDQRTQQSQQNNQ